MESNVVCFLLQKMSNWPQKCILFNFYQSTPLLKFQFALLTPTLETGFVCIQTYQVSQRLNIYVKLRYSEFILISICKSEMERDMSSPEPDFGTADTSSPIPSSAHAPLTVPPLIITLTGPSPKITKKQNPTNRQDKITSTVAVVFMILKTVFGTGSSTRSRPT